jgi:hypothetical protein
VDENRAAKDPLRTIEPCTTAVPAPPVSTVDHALKLPVSNPSLNSTAALAGPAVTAVRPATNAATPSAIPRLVRAPRPRKIMRNPR